MSAICGFINLNGQLSSSEIGSAMMEKLAIYPADSSEQWYGNQVFLGCHHQVVTPESTFEKLPHAEYASGLAITADAIIDNRHELWQVFAIPEAQGGTLTDSQLILLAYKKWGTECPVHLVGDYAFAIWDNKQQQLFCARDQVGKRTFYYTHQTNLFAFCTVMKPLFALPNIDNTLNDQWLADFLAIHTVSHELDYNHTVYKEIEQLAPAHSMVVKPDGLHKAKYWDPLKLPKLEFKTEAKYYAAFREIFSEAVRCRIRSVGAVGIMLSGGLDSGAVACVGAGQLREQGKRLQAFSALPMEGYTEWLSPGYIADESTYIEAVREHCGNIDVTYCRSEGRNSVSDIDRFLALMEQPYKIVENLFWVDTIIEAATKNKCSVLLGGQFGNSTISYGDFLTQAFTLYKQGRMIALYKEITGYCRLHRLSRKKFGKYLLKLFLSRLYPIRIKKKGNNLPNAKSTFINPELAQRYNTSYRLKKIGYSSSSPPIYTLSEYRQLILNSPAFSHIGAMETKLSLAYGIAQRDPTRDKRLIEFCFRLPGSLYVKGGQERLLVRRAMEGILPDKVRLNTNERGIQSADWLQRISPAWSEIQEKLLEKLYSDRLQSYVDVTQARQTLSLNQALIPRETNQVDIRMLLVVLILGRYLDKFEEETREEVILSRNNGVNQDYLV